MKNLLLWREYASRRLWYRRGFALPAILITSVVMLGVLVVSVSAAASIRSNLQQQYYVNQAGIAAESGLAYAFSCMGQAGGAITWTSGAPLRPNTNCSGVVDAGKLAHYAANGTTTMRFSVVPGAVAADGTTRLQSTGYVDLRRNLSAGAVYQTHSQTLTRASWDARHITRVSASRTHSCILTTDRQVYCTGSNTEGQLGIGKISAKEPMPGVPFLLPVNLYALDVVAGEEQTCVRANDEQLYCAGVNTYGNIGRGGVTTESVSTPARFIIPAGRKVLSAQIATNVFGVDPTTTSRPYTCALTTATNGSDRQVYCAGSNQFGQFGAGTTSSAVRTPIKFNLGLVAGGSAWTVRSFSVGSSDFGSTVDAHSHTCVVTMLDEAFCAGKGGDGQLGDGAGTNSSTPVRFGTGANKVRMFVGYRISCELTQTGNIWCAGMDRYGRLGNGTANDHGNANNGVRFIVPVGAGSVVDLAVGPNQLCALTTTNEVYCAGFNAYGRLGDGTTTDRSTPVKFAIPGSGATTSATAVDIGDIQTCALTATSQVYCAGYNVNGQLGIGSFTPAQDNGGWTTRAAGWYRLPTGVTATELYAENRSTCVRASNGRGYCAGSNSYGQLGNNASVDQATPVEAYLLKRLPFIF